MAVELHTCVSCGVTNCRKNRRHAVEAPPAERIAYLVDAAWPEYVEMIASARRPDDQLIAPGLLGRPVPGRYRWPEPVAHRGTLATANRHLAMRRVARAAGGVRQRQYLRHDRSVAFALATAIDYRARHLVVAQAWLPWLDEAGALGGRSFDVLMSRYPLAEIHRKLDEVAAETGASTTIGDFRADPDLVAREAALLARARRIVTPHHGIGGLFAERAIVLDWNCPAPRPRRSGERVAFLGPTITRQRPDIVRGLAGGLKKPLIVFGDMLAGADFWEGVTIERRSLDPSWLDDIGTLLHPAALTHEPRRLLEAAASGVRIYATPECGLDPIDYLPFEDFRAGARSPAARSAQAA